VFKSVFCSETTGGISEGVVLHVKMEKPSKTSCPCDAAIEE